MSQGQDWNQPGSPANNPQDQYGQANPLQGAVVAAAGYGVPGSAAPQVPPGFYYDQLSGLTLPDGTALASAGRRIGAYFLAFPLALVTLFIGYVIWGAVAWANGQTPTQVVLKTRYWNLSKNSPATWGTMFLGQFIGRIVDYICLGGIVSLIMLAVTKEKRTLYDALASCVVLHDPNDVLG